ncbi:type I restriction endonuclease subunit R [Synoicihabitans lomoniglobus]|uniref:type I site-specific deoxyribonuclease n=1 Tax=Synoicihabitans lomoniglobus TaxID=2909285 RepID=A0AAF0CHD6_9BACT|nr:DEAD/DEAH box helicase family protein [Opitutaceae bacterium LMO-M01]WED64187.1 DEAD/DEAH box helicase family protein [Opitutaceae bacterium LMO-M01]
MAFNEDSRVKIPAILHLTRLGYSYVSLKGATWDASSNIFPSVFKTALLRINPDAVSEDIDRTLQETSLLLDNEDLGKAFHERLLSTTGIKLVDFENFDRNCFQVVTELPCINGDEEFRPDITLLVNGMPLVFIEVKKPNNREGILAERNRIAVRCQNPKFRRFVNITQLMMFSNNMEYDDESHEPIEGAFYASTDYENPSFNYFREENQSALPALPPLDSATENLVLTDNNLQSLKHAPEYATNCNPDSPTNRLSTSLFCRSRLAFLLRYGFAFVRDQNGFEKHIMRYPQIFATHAIETKIESGTRKGIIWHTQGSGKTALAFYNVKHLTDYYQGKGVIPKFYFIVDRIDLLIQAAREFRNRGLMVHEVDSRDEFARDIKSTQAIHNDSGKLEITVVNIQKFADDPSVVSASDYDIRLQRIYFLDEVHRSYNPTGSFLANLTESDPHAIKIGLTGTPLLGDDFNSKKLFGDYIHKYYYNASIKDGYTLRLIREEIETEYKLQLAKTMEEIEILRGSGNREFVYSHEKFVEPMLDYIVSDFEAARLMHDDTGIGAMVICDSSAQAKKMHEIFVAKYPPAQTAPGSTIPFAPAQLHEEPLQAAEDPGSYGAQKKHQRAVKTAALILHDVGTKDSRKQQVEDFKEGKIDLLFVYNMLLTGFDSRRLKKLYLGRLIKAHNLLQALTRVNRTYKSFRYGYVVDFADITTEFEKTNQAYFKELQSELGDEMEHYSDLFKTKAEIEADIDTIKDALWEFDTLNAEIFSQQITQIQDRGQMLAIVKALNTARELYNVIRLSGRYELLESLDFKKVNQLATEAQNHLNLLNQKIALEDGHDNTSILNVALESVLFTFRKISEDELRIADELKEILRKTREVLLGNFDPRDPVFVSLKDELERLFRKKKLSEITQDEMSANIEALNAIHAQARELERKNQLLRAKYAHDAKYARIHKRLMEKGDLNTSERKLFEALTAFKAQADAKILQNAQLLNNPAYTEKELLRLVAQQFNAARGFSLDATSLKALNGLILKEYLDEFHGKIPA